MIFKILGAAIIIITSYILGLYLTKRDKYRLEDIEETKKGLSIIKGEIGFLSLPLGEAFAGAAERTAGGVSALWGSLAKAFDKKDGRSASDIWNESLEKSMPGTYLAPEDKGVLVSYGKTLGYMDTEQQRAGIDIAVLNLSENQSALMKKRDGGGKVYQSLCLLTGILIAVILA